MSSMVWQWAMRAALAAWTGVALVCCADGVDPAADPCAGQSGALTLDKAAVLAMTSETGPLSAGATVALVPPMGEAPVEYGLTLRNAANPAAARPLTLTSAALTAVSGATAAPFALFVDDDGKWHPISEAKFPLVLVPTGFAAACRPTGAKEVLKLQVRLGPVAAATKATADLVLQFSGDPKVGGSAVVHFVAKATAARLKLQPTELQFGKVKLGTKAATPLQLLSVGDGPLLVTAIEVAKDQPGTFTLQLGEHTFQSGQTVNLTDQPLVVAPGAALTGAVTYSPHSGAPDFGQLVFATNDASGPAKVALYGNQDTPCLGVAPGGVVDFGFVDIGGAATREVALTNCGATAVHVSASSLTGGGNAFEVVSFVKLGVGVQPKPDPLQPLEISLGEKVAVTLRCTPPTEQKDAAGNWLPYAATLTFQDDTVLPDKPVPLRCTGTATGCPTPVVAAEPAWTVPPQAGVTLIGTGSHALGGKKVAKYQWTLLSAPEGASSVAFHPAANVPNPKLGVKRKGKVNGVLTDVVALDVAGDYQVRLVVTDDQGVANCLPVTETVHVIPEAAVFAELVWSTPGDPTPDTGPGMGADLDLHFAHPGAANAKKCATPPALCAGKPCPCQPDHDGDGTADPWFHPLYDCFWNNPHPNWGSVDPLVDDDPSLDLDDTDGFGPETLHLNAPQYGAQYTLGVHSWDAHDYGPSLARVRVWVGGLLQAVVQRNLGECDLWWATAVAWPQGVVAVATDGKGAGKVVGGYQSAAVGLVSGKCGGK